MERSDYKILVVDDNETVLQATKHYLERHEYRVEIARNGFEAIEKLDADPFAYALVILDYDMPGINGGETARKLVEINRDIFIIIFSAVTHVSLKASNIEFVEKGIVKPDELIATVNSWCRKFEETCFIARRPGTLDENERLISSFGLVGRSQALADDLRIVERYEAARSEASVLIRGESGTGKEKMARVIHEHSPRKDGPFVAINMAAIPAELVESELFGHKKGSFTGALQDRKGYFETAEGGTIFLDEIGDTTLKVQVKLLRVLQERVFIPVGRNEPIAANVRIIAATNKDLEKAMDEGGFREDLYYRLNGTTIFIPPLRERIKDIEPIILATCERYNKVRGTKKAFLKSTVELMERLTWKGNIRELENIVEKYLVECTDDKIPPTVLDPAFYREAPNLKVEYEQLVARQERETLEFFKKVLSRYHSQRHAAVDLGIPQTTLIGILERLGLPTDFKKNVPTGLVKAVGGGLA